MLETHSICELDDGYVRILMQIRKLTRLTLIVKCRLNRRQGIKNEAALNDGLSVHLSNLPGGTNGTRPTVCNLYRLQIPVMVFSLMS